MTKEEDYIKYASNKDYFDLLQISNNPDEILSLQSNMTRQIMEPMVVRSADKKVIH